MQNIRNLFRKNKPAATSPMIGLGIIIGTLLGILTDNLSFWIALGLVFGVALDRSCSRQRR